MKRSGFKRVPKIMKIDFFPTRKGLRRKSKSPQIKLEDELWQHCRRITKAKYALKDGSYVCFTCGKPIEGSNCQLGHFIPKSVGGVLLRYNLSNLRLQCYYCNINLGGNGSTFYKKLLEEMGQEHIDKLFQLKTQTKKGSDHYLTLLEEYSKL